MDATNLKSYLGEHLNTEGFEPDAEETYIIIDYRGTHQVTTWRRGDAWVTFTQTVQPKEEELPF